MFRVALGYDLHRLRFEPNSMMKCCGILIPSDYLIEQAHSDGDVVLHALTDALLSVAGTDIGIAFPNTDAVNKNRASIDFLDYAFEEMSREYDIVNIDIVVICDFPKISSYSSEMKIFLEKVLQISSKNISIRGKTTENTRPLMIEAYANVLFKKRN